MKICEKCGHHNHNPGDNYCPICRSDGIWSEIKVKVRLTSKCKNCGRPNHNPNNDDYCSICEPDGTWSRY